jgi:hypothetical protein
VWVAVDSLIEKEINKEGSGDFQDFGKHWGSGKQKIKIKKQNRESNVVVTCIGQSYFSVASLIFVKMTSSLP